MKDLLHSIDKGNIPSEINKVINKIYSFERITSEDALLLYTKADLGVLGLLANFIKENKSGKKVFFNKNIHIEPTNICIHNCKFCSYKRKEGEEGSWVLSAEDIFEKIKKTKGTKITEVHIVGGTHPSWDVYYWGSILRKIKKINPDIFIKAFTSVELHYMINLAGLSLFDGIKYLKECGLDSIPGGGAEIFEEEIRNKICKDKISGEEWLKIHEIAHNLGIKSNATMLYGHIESYRDRIDHMERLRNLQDETNGFFAFIPLKYRSKANNLSYIGEVSIIEDIKNYAISRIYLDNFPHIKTYWPMLGKANSNFTLLYGVDDFDGTIEDTTKIYSLAGAEEQHPSMKEEEVIMYIKNLRLIPVERNTIYNEISVYN